MLNAVAGACSAAAPPVNAFTPWTPAPEPGAPVAPATGDPAVPVAQVLHEAAAEDADEGLPVAPATGEPLLPVAHVLHSPELLTTPATGAPGLPLPTAASGVAAVGTTVLVMGPVGTGIVTVTVIGVAAQPELQTVSVV